MVNDLLMAGPALRVSSDVAPRTLTQGYKVYEVIEGHNATLGCRVFGSPLPTISW